MITIETAKKLKDEGLKWEPKVGDYYYYDSNYQMIKSEREAEWIEEDICNGIPGYYFAPKLDQLLMEIEKQGWQIELVKLARWKMTIWRVASGRSWLFTGETFEEATADALLWLLEQE